MLARGFVAPFFMDFVQYVELLYEFHMRVTRQPSLRDTNPPFLNLTIINDTVYDEEFWLFHKKQLYQNISLNMKYCHL